MDTLPLELKQRVCSCLTTNDLKSLRLASKVYSVAAYRYLLRRVFLLNHPDSCQEAWDIANHPDLSHCVTTLVVDTSCLRSYPRYAQWGRIFAEVELEPLNLMDSEGAEDTSVKISARSERVLRRERNSERWTAYEERAQIQRTDASRKLMLMTIAFVFQKCSKLSNLILDGHHTHMDNSALVKKREQFFRGIIGSATPNYGYERLWVSTGFNLWEILKPVHEANRALKSLVLLDPGLDIRPRCTFRTTSIFQSLKHLRQRGCPPDILTFVVTSAPNLETFGTIEYLAQQTSSFSALMSVSPLSKLRACSLTCTADTTHLVSFLLRNSSTLQRLRICNTYSHIPGGWSSFVTQVKGKLRELRRIELVGLETRPRIWNPTTRATVLHLMTERDILHHHEHELETGPAQFYDGLWKDYETMFFPQTGMS